eukprot:GHVP01046350.1.p1 GENE.GHVP01046350.1~~GHVP01046350.1.p1  ORF type:complete len:118 (-),score=21.42 GHVP01046350.1:1100-1453(-)
MFLLLFVPKKNLRRRIQNLASLTEEMGSQNSTISHQPEAHPSAIPGLSTANQESDVIPSSIQQRSFFGNQQKQLNPAPDREVKLPDDVVTCLFTWKQTGAHMGLEVRVFDKLKCKEN